ncbi:hypothetical protein Q5692_10115 [Microcoleus sp. C2C3]|uniref:hypothetical protein n=1 Tax=unclassified Microcoleus TaxID=2642155 RepID=UPI002FD60B66
MQNTCTLWRQSFYLPTQVERKLKETCGFSVGASIARRDPRKPIGRSILGRSGRPDRHLNPDRADSQGRELIWAG